MKKLIALLLVLYMLAAFAGCTTKEKTVTAEPAAEAVSLQQALENTLAAICGGKPFDLTVDGLITYYSETDDDLYTGKDNSIYGELTICLDKESQELSVYGMMSTEGMMTTGIIHDGWVVVYDTNKDAYYKMDFSDQLEKLFSEGGSSFEFLMTEDELEELEEDLDIEKLPALFQTLATEKFSDQAWLQEACGYTVSQEGSTVTHSFRCSIREVLTELSTYCEDTFTEDGYEELTRAIKRMDKETVLLLTLTQENDMITAIDLEIWEPEGQIDNLVRLNFTLENIGTAELDTDMLEDVLEDLDEVNESGNHFGTIDGQSYSNKAAGIAIELPKDWAVATQEEAAELVGMSSSALGLEDSLAEYGIACDLYAVYSDGRSTLNVMIQENSFMIRNMADEDFMQNSLDSTVSSLKSIGLKNVKGALSTITFAGQERIVIEVSGSMNGVTLYESIVVIRTDDYVYMITVSTPNTDHGEEFLSLFTEA